MKQILLGLAVLVMPSGAFAQMNHSPADTTPAERKFSEDTGMITDGALAFLNSGDPSRALPLLEQALSRGDMSPYEKATLYQMQGAAYYDMNDNQAAITAFENAMESQGLSREESDQLTLNIAQLHFAESHYAQTIALLESYASRKSLTRNLEQILKHAKDSVETR